MKMLHAFIQTYANATWHMWPSLQALHASTVVCKSFIQKILIFKVLT